MDMTEQPVGRAEITVTQETIREGVNYESAIMSALIAQDMSGGPWARPDPDLVAWKMSGGREPGPRLAGAGLMALFLSKGEPEAGIGTEGEPEAGIGL
jgi:hypothetical protein